MKTKEKIIKKGNISPSTKCYNNCLQDYFSVWEVTYIDGEIVHEKCLKINQREKELRVGK